MFAFSHRKGIKKSFVGSATSLNFKRTGQELHLLAEGSMSYLCLPSANGHFLNCFMLKDWQQPWQSTAGTCPRAHLLCHQQCWQLPTTPSLSSSIGRAAALTDQPGRCWMFFPDNMKDHHVSGFQGNFLHLSDTTNSDCSSQISRNDPLQKKTKQGCFWHSKQALYGCEPRLCTALVFLVYDEYTYEVFNWLSKVPMSKGMFKASFWYTVEGILEYPRENQTKLLKGI